MDAALLKPLRNRDAGTAEFRQAANTVCRALIDELQETLRKRGVHPDRVALVIILRSAMAFLDAATRAFPGSPVGVLGLKRDERTAVAHWYYENVPSIAENQTIVILDPMLATGGSAAEAVKKVLSLGAQRERIYFVGVIAAPEGMERLTQMVPNENVIVGTIDDGLDAKKYIVPGLGDFGDRYFGYGAS